MPITIADVAARAKVSKTTVSRVLNGKGELDESTAARVRKVIEELGYVPSSRAVGLARGRTRVVGMLVPSLTWPWIGEVLQGAVDVLETERYGLLLFTCNRGEESMRQFGAQVSAKSLRRAAGDRARGHPRLHRHTARPRPAGGADRRPRHPAGPDPERGHHQPHRRRRRRPAPARDRPAPAAGHRRAASASAAREQRLDGFAARLRRGRPSDPGANACCPATSPSPAASTACSEALETGVEFDAVFAHNDLSATGAMQAVLDSGRRIPQDVAVVGFDDIPMAAHTQPPLTTVHQPLREMGEAAARMLLAHFEGSPLPNRPDRHPRHLHRPRLHRRASHNRTGPIDRTSPAHADPSGARSTAPHALPRGTPLTRIRNI